MRLGSERLGIVVPFPLANFLHSFSEGACTEFVAVNLHKAARIIIAFIVCRCATTTIYTTMRKQLPQLSQRPLHFSAPICAGNGFNGFNS